MKRIFQIMSMVLIALSWIALCGLGASAPTLIRPPISLVIEKLKKTEIESESVQTWDAFNPIFDFTEQTGNRIIVLATLMLAGFAGFHYSRSK